MVCLLISQPAYASQNREPSSEYMEQAILRLLCGSMLDAVGDYYSHPRLYWTDSDKVLSVRPVPDTPYYEVVVQVETFYGPHNPPFGIETMTFYVSCGEIVLKDFKHQDKSD